MNAPDRVGAALWSILAGSTAGAAATAAALLLSRSPDLLLFIFGGGIAAGVIVGWAVSGAVHDTWRRAVTAAICAFGATLLIIGTIIVDLLGRALGIAAYGVVLTLVAVFAGYRAVRAGRPTP